MNINTVELGEMAAASALVTYDKRAVALLKSQIYDQIKGKQPGLKKTKSKLRHMFKKKKSRDSKKSKSENSRFDFSVNICVCGDLGSGKHSLISRFVDRHEVKRSEESGMVRSGSYRRIYFVSSFCISIRFSPLLFFCFPG